MIGGRTCRSGRANGAKGRKSQGGRGARRDVVEVAGTAAVIRAWPRGRFRQLSSLLRARRGAGLPEPVPDQVREDEVWWRTVVSPFKLVILNLFQDLSGGWCWHVMGQTALSVCWSRTWTTGLMDSEPSSGWRRVWVESEQSAFRGDPAI